MAELDLYLSYRHAAERALSDTFGSPVRLTVTDKFDSRHLVLRCKLIAASDAAPNSVVLKQMAVDAPPEQQPYPLACFLNELASLRFFSDLRNQLDIGPRLYCSHWRAGLLIL